MKNQTEYIPVAVIGGGQAGLSTGYHLSRLGLPFVILDGSQRIGDVWRSRWDSLRLFTPASYDGLDGMPFPAPPDEFPTKDQMANYLEDYAANFRLPVRNGFVVDGLWRQGDKYVISSGRRSIFADHVVVAMANYQVPQVPDFARQLRPDICQFHSRDYRNPSQLKAGSVLLAGGGNSGSEIALDVARHHRTWMSGRDTGHIPFRIDGLAARLFLRRFVLRFVFHRLLTVNTPMGRKARPKIQSQGGPLIRVKPGHLAAAGVERVPKIAGVQDGMPVLTDGRVLDVENVIWCTGFTPGFSWIRLPIFAENGQPRHSSGVVDSEPGMYFVGLQFLHAFSSSMIHGVGRDAERIARVIKDRMRDAPPQQPNRGQAVEMAETYLTAH